MTGFGSRIGETAALLQSLATPDIVRRVESAVDLLCRVVKERKPLLVCGNGGSASDALHISGELVGRFLIERAPIDVICLNANVSVLTAWSNDYDYASVSKHMEQFGVNQTVAEGLHDDAEISLNMFIDDPKSIRYDERATAKKLTINGVSLADRKKATVWAKQIVEFRAKVTTEAIEKATANKGTLPAPPRRPAGS